MSFLNFLKQYNLDRFYGRVDGNQWLDLSGNNHHATRYNIADSQIINGIPAVPGSRGFSIDPIDDRLVSTAVDSQTTINWFVRYTKHTINDSNWDFFVREGDNGTSNTRYSLAMFDGRLCSFVHKADGSNAAFAVMGSAASLGTHTAALSINATYLTIFLDGEVVAQEALTGEMNTNTSGPLYLGCYQQSNQLDGGLHAAWCCKADMSDAEINELCRLSLEGISPCEIPGLDLGLKFG